MFSTLFAIALLLVMGYFALLVTAEIVTWMANRLNVRRPTQFTPRFLAPIIRIITH
jgi:hypothetical protein